MSHVPCLSVPVNQRKTWENMNREDIFTFIIYTHLFHIAYERAASSSYYDIPNTEYITLISAADTQKCSSNRWIRIFPKTVCDLHCGKFTSNPTGKPPSCRASHSPPGEIIPIAIWRINSVTYGNFKIHLICVGCARTRNESCSLVSSLMHFG